MENRRTRRGYYSDEANGTVLAMTLPTNMIFETKRNPPPQSFQRSWYLKLNDPTKQRALWLRFTVLSTKNGFKRAAEVSAVVFQRQLDREIKKTAFKQTFEIDSFSVTKEHGAQIGNCQVSENHTLGTIQSKGHSIRWDLKMEQKLPNNPGAALSEIFAQSGFIKNGVTNAYEKVLFSGTLQMNDEEVILWKDAPGMEGYLYESRSPHSWIWGHCNCFVDSHGNPANLVFEGLTSRAVLGPLVAPPLSSFFFHYKGKDYNFSTLRDVLYLRSRNTLNEWDFRAERGDLSFHGNARAEHKDFAGITYEDTNGSLLYSCNSKLSDMKIHIYRRGKLESSFIADGTAALEIVSRQKNPYVPLLI
jgi:hypothetical protein